MENNRKITGYLINPDYQGKFLLIFGGFGLLQIFFFFYSLTQIFETAKAATLNPDMNANEIVENLSQIQGEFNLLFGGVFVLLFVIFLVISFRFTHKTAGAVYHIQKTFDDIEKDGKMKEMKLRDGDFFREVQDSFNKMIKKF